MFSKDPTTSFIKSPIIVILFLDFSLAKDREWGWFYRVRRHREIVGGCKDIRVISLVENISRPG
jgi:hypothetical protein